MFYVSLIPLAPSLQYDINFMNTSFTVHNGFQKYNLCKLRGCAVYVTCTYYVQLSLIHFSLL